MEKSYDHKVVEEKIRKIWEKSDYFTPKIDPQKKPFSILLPPPNASGPMHVGNALDIAIQDILARYYRAKGVPTLWIPSTDHGGYETQVTFERKLEEEKKDKFTYSNKELFKKIEKFVNKNNDLIKNQIKSLGASVDWSRFRFTMDEMATKTVQATFRKMVNDGIIYRAPYMVYYCPVCKTVLADIELQKKEEIQPLYFIKFPFVNEEGHLSLATTHPEFIFASTNLLIEKENTNYSHFIGKKNYKSGKQSAD